MTHGLWSTDFEYHILMRDFIFVSEYLKLLNTDNGKLAQSR